LVARWWRPLVELRFVYVSAGSGWMFYFVVTVQTTVNTGVSIGSILLAADCLQVRRRRIQESTNS
jgi:low affinity Fe/Cu permease